MAVLDDVLSCILTLSTGAQENLDVSAWIRWSRCPVASPFTL